MTKEVIASRFIIVCSTIIMSFISCSSNPGIKFVVTNKDAQPIDRLHIYVTGNIYLIKDIKPGETRNARLSVKGESDIQLKADNNNKMTVEVYFEPDQNGTVKASITKDSVVSFSHSFY